MCELCHEETDDDYTGDSIAEKRQKATRSIVERHPEFGLSPNDVRYRFAPEAEERCIRVNLTGSEKQYEIHVPGSLGQAMSSSASIRGIAMVAWIESEQTYEEICEKLKINSRTSYDAMFVSEVPPIDPGRKNAHQVVDQYEHDIQEHRSKTE